MIAVTQRRFLKMICPLKSHRWHPLRPSGGSCSHSWGCFYHLNDPGPWQWWATAREFACTLFQRLLVFCLDFYPDLNFNFKKTFQIWNRTFLILASPDSKIYHGFCPTCSEIKTGDFSQWIYLCSLSASPIACFEIGRQSLYQQHFEGQWIKQVILTQAAHSQNTLVARWIIPSKLSPSLKPSKRLKEPCRSTATATAFHLTTYIS